MCNIKSKFSDPKKKTVHDISFFLWEVNYFVQGCQVVILPLLFKNSQPKYDKAKISILNEFLPSLSLFWKIQSNIHQITPQICVCCTRGWGQVGRGLVSGVWWRGRSIRADQGRLTCHDTQSQLLRVSRARNVSRLGTRYQAFNYPGPGHWTTLGLHGSHTNQTLPSSAFTGDYQTTVKIIDWNSWVAPKFTFGLVR